MNVQLLKTGYFNMVQSRYCQKKLLDYGIGMYTEIAEEAITAGLIPALDPEDIVACYFRGEGSTLRYKGGITLREQMCCWMGRLGEEGYINASLPSAWTDVEHGVIGTSSSLIGGDADVAVGVALAQKKLKSGKIVAFISGDGATSKGNFHEMCNWSGRFNLPLLIIVRGNKWAMSTMVENNTHVTSIEDMVRPFGLKTWHCTGNDIEKVYETVSEAADYVRHTGPALVYMDTYRVSGHSAHDEDDYRDPAVKAEWLKNNDPIVNAEASLKKAGVSEEEIAALNAQAKKEVDEAYDWALTRPEITVKQFLDKQEEVVRQMWGQEG